MHCNIVLVPYMLEQFRFTPYRDIHPSNGTARELVQDARTTNISRAARDCWNILLLAKRPEPMGITSQYRFNMLLLVVSKYPIKAWAIDPNNTNLIKHSAKFPIQVNVI